MKDPFGEETNKGKEKRGLVGGGDVKKKTGGFFGSGKRKEKGTGNPREKKSPGGTSP